MNSDELDEFKDDIPTTPWLGFDHDSSYYPVVPFLYYPIVRGWTMDEITHPGRTLIRDPDRALPMIQSWLIFGILEGASMVRWESHISDDEFLKGKESWLRVSHGGYVICFNLLNALRETWEYFISRTRRSREDLQGDFRETFLRVGMLTSELVHVRDTVDLREGCIPLSMLDSILRCTYIFQENVAQSAPQVLTLQQSFNQVFWKPTQGLSAAIEARLARRGWCPSTFSSLQRSGSFSFLEFASYFEATDLPQEKHAACTKERCIANNIDYDNCQARHRVEGCQCGYAKAPADKIKEIINDGGFPVVTGTSPKITTTEVDGVVTYNITSEFDLTVERYHPGMRLLTISHVWSDALMGSAENGLPQCQVQYLLNVMRTLDMACFWQDTLLIPRDSSTRGKAIAKMSEIYHEASKTVVLDHGLMRIDVPAESRSCLALRILTSVWMHRLWTLQEAVLAKDLILVFRDGLVSLNQIIDEIQKHPENAIMKIFVHEVGSLLGRWFKYPGLARTASMLRDRDSSRVDDEALAIAPVLGIKDIMPLIAAKKDERMRLFWLLLGRVSKSIVFMDNPKLKIDGARALPRRLLGITTRLSMTRHDEAAEVISQGLKATYFVYRHPGIVRLDSADTHYAYDTQLDEWISIFVDNDAHDFESGSSAHEVIITLKRIAAPQAFAIAVAALTTNRFVDGVPVFQYIRQLEMNPTRASSSFVPPQDASGYTHLRGKMEEIIIA